MSPELTFDNKKFLSSRHAGEIAGYTNDYVARLCRQGKVAGRMVGRAWYVEEESFKNFLNENSAVKEKRKATLSLLRKREYQTVVVPPSESVHRSGMPLESFERETASRSDHVGPKSRRSSFCFPVFKMAGAFAVAVLIIVSVGLFTNDRFLFRVNDTETASVLGSVGSWVAGLWDTTQRGVLSLMTTTFRTLSRSDDELPGTAPTVVPPALPKERDGVVVVPSSEIGADGEQKKKEIQDAFSDEIRIVPDLDGRAGVIRPIFKTAEEEDYLYVLVPVDETDGSSKKESRL